MVSLDESVMTMVRLHAIVVHHVLVVIVVVVVVVVRGVVFVI